MERFATCNACGCDLLEGEEDICSDCEEAENEDDGGEEEE